MTAENYFIKDQNSVYYLTFTRSSGYAPKFAAAGDDLQSSPFSQGYEILYNGELLNLTIFRQA
jgi:hypothetical protein